jgi:hypothetical protein
VICKLENCIYLYKGEKWPHASQNNRRIQIMQKKKEGKYSGKKRENQINDKGKIVRIMGDGGSQNQKNSVIKIK